MLIIHSEGDKVVPIRTSLNAWAGWIDNGADSKHVLSHSQKDENHSETAFEGILLGLDFFQKYR
ncbi:hypothetical protein POV27_17470 [Aureisphaera galaxeae]|nr:hypothetical protein [Aureisphaera galaxeae]